MAGGAHNFITTAVTEAEAFCTAPENPDLVSHGIHVTQRWSNDMGLSSSFVPLSREGTSKKAKVIHIWAGTI